MFDLRGWDFSFSVLVMFIVQSFRSLYHRDKIESRETIRFVGFNSN